MRRPGQGRGSSGCGCVLATHTRAVGEYGKCVSTHLFKIVDYELQFEKYIGPGCV
jgi:hypothetical protein